MKWNFENIEQFKEIELNPLSNNDLVDLNPIEELQAFKLFFSDDVCEDLTLESKIYYENFLKEELKEKYSTEYNNYTQNSLSYLYFKKGILPKDFYVISE